MGYDRPKRARPFTGERITVFFLAYHSSKVALLRKEKNLYRIEHLSTLGDGVNPLYILKPLLLGKTFDLVTGLETRDVLLRTLTLKLKAKREILAALPFQVENLLPFALSELILLPTLYAKKSETDVHLLATSQTALKRHLDDAAQLEIDPDVVSSVPSALFRFAAHFFPEHSDLFVYHCEGDQNSFIVIKEGRIAASQVHKSQDFERLCAFMHKKYPEIEHIVYTGTDNLPTSFIPLELKDPNLAEYAIPIGLALDAAKGDRQSCQFRLDKNLSKKRLKKKKTELLGFVAACLFFVCATLFLGQLHLKKQEMAILEALGSPKGARLHQVTEELANALQGQKTSTLPVPTIPKVHEVLTWLSTHPMLTDECSITRLRYQIIEAPKLGSQQKTYAATLDLELSLPSAKTARNFHESLLKDNQMIDQKNPIQWSGDHGIFQLKFHLKNN